MLETSSMQLSLKESKTKMSSIFILIVGILTHGWFPSTILVSLTDQHMEIRNEAHI